MSSTFDNKRVLVDNILTFYNKIKPKNPTNSYTVLAAIIDPSLNDDNKIIALASGTQANLSVYLDDIKDCHAESIVRRAYKRYIIDSLLEKVIKSKDSKDVEKFIEQELQQNLILFISQFPCGFLKRYEGDEPIDKVTGKTIKRKPGRGTLKDGHIVYLEKDPCCDKLKRWLKEGFQGKKLKQLFAFEAKITKILIGNCENDECFDYKIGIEKFKQLITDDGFNQTIEVELVDIVDKKEFTFHPEQQPQPVSVAWWSSKTKAHDSDKSSLLKNMEYIVDGRRIGLTKKLLAKDLPNDKLKIANYWLNRDLDQIEQLFKSL